MPEIRPFARHDRDQLTDLVNAHIKAIIPGCSIPVATLLSQMERDPGEYIVDPWVIERETWVAIEADRLVAAVHLHRYGSDPSVGASPSSASMSGRRRPPISRFHFRHRSRMESTTPGHIWPGWPATPALRR